ncbi:methyltransferase domain-containing protein [Streptomyces sp. NPDC006638]|uniref:methyltransferase domain-containing protein n=1 Tax=Streptomyces sp. NPDC006638 TaxID=3157183 RepID=UPI0033B5787A
MDSWDAWRRGLAAEMDRRGDWPVRSPWVRRAADAVPRHLFAPDRLWHWDGRAYVPVDRDGDPDGWSAEVYGDPDSAAVTQVTDGLPSSSLSCEAVVADMLDSLLLEPGHRVLELGTGTGRNAALLAWRAGAELVTTVEVDPGLAVRARERLGEAGDRVRVVVGDGGTGWPAGAPYDRVMATYAVDRIPWAWVAQTRPGGRIVTPWGRLGHVALTVAEDGASATGWVQGLAQFMSARGTTGPGRTFSQVRGTAPAEAERSMTRNLGPLRNDVHLRFALRVALPDVRITTAEDEDGLNAWLHTEGGCSPGSWATSWATLSAVGGGGDGCGGGGGTVVHQGGPRRLADELEEAWDAWVGVGSPSLYDYGMTVEPDGQYVWCGDAARGPRWPSVQAEG